MPPEEGTIENQPVTSPHEEQARSQGWRPLEEWDGSPEDWVDAKTFNRNGEYMERIKSQSSLIKKLERRLESQEATTSQLIEHHQKVKEIEYERALKDLKALKKESLDLGDHDRVVEIDDKIIDLKRNNEAKPVPKADTGGVDPDVSQWMEANPWYQEDPALAGAVNGIISDLVAKDPSLKDQVREVLDRATTKLKEEFPNKFAGKQRMTRVTETSGTDTVPTKSGTAPKYTARHLNPEQMKFATKFVKMGAVKSVDEYAQQLADIGGLDVQMKGA